MMSSACGPADFPFYFRPQAIRFGHLVPQKSGEDFTVSPFLALALGLHHGTQPDAARGPASGIFQSQTAIWLGV